MADQRRIRRDDLLTYRRRRVTSDGRCTPAWRPRRSYDEYCRVAYVALLDASVLHLWLAWLSYYTDFDLLRIDSDRGTRGWREEGLRSEQADQRGTSLS